MSVQTKTSQWKLKINHNEIFLHKRIIYIYESDCTLITVFDYGINMLIESQILNTVELKKR